MVAAVEVVADGQHRQRLHAELGSDAVEAGGFHVEREDSEPLQQRDQLRVGVVEEIAREHAPDAHRRCALRGRDLRQQPPARGGAEIVALETQAVHARIGRSAQRQHHFAELHAGGDRAADADPKQPAHAVIAHQLRRIQHRRGDPDAGTHHRHAGALPFAGVAQHVADARDLHRTLQQRRRHVPCPQRVAGQQDQLRECAGCRADVRCAHVMRSTSTGAAGATSPMV